MKLAFLTSLFLFNLLELHASGVEKDSAMGYISFDAQQVQGNFIPNIPNCVFLKNIFPYLYPLPPYFGALPFAEDNTYKLINKDWAQIQPSISDLFYYYHIVNGQLCDTDLDFYINQSKTSDNSIFFHVNRRNYYFIEKLSSNTLKSIQSLQIEFLSKKSDAEKMLNACIEIIEKRIYYLTFFDFLLNEGYLAEWFLCYKLALKYAIEDKRDLKLISDRYEEGLIACRGGLIAYYSSNNKFLNFKKLFGQEKQSLIKNNALNDNAFINVWHDNRYSLGDFLSYCMQSSQNLRNVFYKKFKNNYGNLSIIFDFKKIIAREGDFFCRDFIICMRSFIEDIIKKNYLSDDVKLLYYYLMAEKDFLPKRSIRLPVNIVPIYHDRLEQILLNEVEINNYTFDQICNLFVSDVFYTPSRSKALYYKFLSVKRIIVYLYRHQKKSTVLPFVYGIFWGFLSIYILIKQKFFFVLPVVFFAFFNLAIGCQTPFYLFRARFFNN